MYFSTVITLCLSILFSNRVGSSLHYILENQLASYDNVAHFENFFVDLNKVFEKKQPWFVIVVVRTNEDLRSAKPSFESHPHMICEKAEDCEHPLVYNGWNIIIIMFLDDLSNKTIEKNMKILSLYNGKILFVFDQHQVKENDISLFSQGILHNGITANFELAHFKEEVADIYYNQMSKNCTVEVALDMTWEVGADLSKLQLSRSIDVDLKGCPLSVGTFSVLPKIITQEDDNGSITIVGGSSGYMVKEIADQLNFKIIAKGPSAESQRLADSQTMATIHDIYSTVVSFGIGGFRPTNDLSRKLSYSDSYDTECLTWGVPRITDMEANNVIWAEFQWKVWVGIGLTFLFVCVIEYVYENLLNSLLENSQLRGADFVSIALNALAMNLGNPTARTTIQTSHRIIFVTVTFYAMVTTTGYKTSLASILATEKTRPAVMNTEAIFKANFIVGGKEYHLDILKDQVNSSEYISKLIERYVIINNNSDAMERLKSDRKFAYLARRSFLMYMKKKTVEAGELITFDILDECVLNYHTVMMFRQNSPLIRSVNRETLQLSESGILDHWESLASIDNKILERKNSELYLQMYTRRKFVLIFIFYGYAVAICILVFLLELLWPRIMKSPEPKRRAPVQRGEELYRYYIE